MQSPSVLDVLSRSVNHVDRAEHDEALRDLAFVRTDLRREQLANAELQRRLEHAEARIVELQEALADRDHHVAVLTERRNELAQALATAELELATLRSE